MQLSNRSKWFSQPIDRYAIGLAVIMSLAIAILIGVGDRTVPQVRDFSWQNQKIDATNNAFILTFSRPMDRDSVEKNLKIEPELKGKISWSSRRMSYTPLRPVPYGKSFTLSLENAYDRFVNESRQKAAISPFVGKFSTPEPRFAYIGLQNEEKGRLILYDVLQKQKRILTPENLLVTDFRIYPDRQKILFGAIAPEGQNLIEQKLYEVNTGIDTADRLTDNPPTIKLVLDNNDYQNFKFDLSPDGQSILVQRLSRKQVGSYGLWLLQKGKEPRSLDNQPGGDFMFTPDSASVAIAQGEGVAILALEPDAPPLDFLPRFGTILSFGRSGTQATTIKFNKDYTRSLYLVNNQGLQKELAKINGSILAAQFDPQEKNIYCLMTDVEQNPEKNIFREKPYLANINLEKNEFRRILDLPPQREIQFRLSPDGQSILLNSVIPKPNQNSSPQPSNESAISSREPNNAPITQLVMLPTITDVSDTNLPLPDVLPLFGNSARWLP
ncbi:MAG: hypothetical protein NW214_09970 [Pseudanabaenaceae cyanobacterium bins.39]|nr:hypothetical protein [Pseudanabaenaceae cyanobacterium bins.39]